MPSGNIPRQSDHSTILSQLPPPSHPHNPLMGADEYPQSKGGSTRYQEHGSFPQGSVGLSASHYVTPSWASDLGAGSSSYLYPPTFEEGPGLSGLPHTESNPFDTRLPPNATVCNLSLSPAIAQASEVLVTTPAPMSSDRSIHPLACGDTLLAGLARMRLSTAMFASTLNCETVAAIPGYLKIYWGRIDPLHPIVHRATFGSCEDESPYIVALLRCAMAAIATQFCEKLEDRVNGHRLHTYVWQQYENVSSPTFASSYPWIAV